MSPATLALILQSLKLLSLGVVMAAELRALFDDQVSFLERIIAEGRDPTPDEHAAFDARLATLRAAFHKPVAPPSA